MKKLLIAAVVSLSLAGCVTVQDVANVVTTNVQNPVTKQSLYQFENGMIVAFAGLNAYKKTCVSGAIPASCKDVIRKMQVYTRKLPAVLADVRRFVKNNDTANAQNAFNLAKSLYADFTALATANNIKVQ